MFPRVDDTSHGDALGFDAPGLRCPLLKRWWLQISDVATRCVESVLSSC